MKVKCEKCGAKEKYLQLYEDMGYLNVYEDYIVNNESRNNNKEKKMWYYFCNKCHHIQPK